MGFEPSAEDKQNTYVILPAYNEATRIQPVIEEIARKGYNMVIVNDGSSDNTLDVILESKKKYPNKIHIFSLLINRGVGVATQTGFEAVLKFNPKYVVSMDSDGQHSPDDLDSVIEPLVAGRAQAVIGVRPLEDMPKSRNFANAVMNLLTKIFYGVDVSDSQTGFRAITNDALNKIQKTATSLQTKTKGINFEHIDADKIKEVESRLEAVQEIAKKGIDLDMNAEEIGALMSELKNIESYINNLIKVEDLARLFDEIKAAAAAAGIEIQDFSAEIKTMQNLASSTDGSFERVFTNVKSEAKSAKSEIKSLNSEMRSLSSSFTGTWSDFTGNFAQFTLAEMAGDLLADGIRRLGEGLVDTVVETDKAMTSLMKVAPETFSGTGEQLDQYLNKVTDVT
uniref:glycosyltransferase family 2 protein n=1 Tax=Methanobrevibacter sp. TaxID=66852 RepID=UPI00388D3A51